MEKHITTMMIERLILGSLSDASWESLNPGNRVMFLTSFKVSYTLLAMLCWLVSPEVYEHPFSTALATTQ